MDKKGLLDKADEIVSKIVASDDERDKYHLGKIIFANMTRFADLPNQIDIVTGRIETHGEVLRRAVHFVKAMTRMGVKKGDVVVIMGTNHLDVCIPLYGCFLMGALPFPLDFSMEVGDLKHTLDIGRPKVIICESSKVLTVKEALAANDLEAAIFAFGEVNGNQCLSFRQLMTENVEDVEFKIAEIDPKSDGVLILSTSGSTGLPKGVLATHKAFICRIISIWLPYDYPATDLRVPLLSPLHWLSAYFSLTAVMMFGAATIQTEQAVTAELALKMIHNYNVKMAIVGTPLASTMTRHNHFRETDFTHLDVLFIGGSNATPSLIQTLQEKLKNGSLRNCYGLTEALGFVFRHDAEKPANPVSFGTKAEEIEVKIVDLESREEVGPNRPGEVLIRGDLMFKEYYRNVKATEEAFEDGWFKSGDLLFYDEDECFYFVERAKMLMKYRNHQISPQEVESVIASGCPDVEAVGVAGIQVPEDGEHPVAFVVRKRGSALSETDIEDVVARELSTFKQLRGGVQFVNSLPVTSTGKLDRGKLKAMALELSTTSGRLRT